MLGVEVDNLAERIGYRFGNPSLASLALRHRSWASEQRPEAGVPPASNERLELLGDAVLDLVVSEHLYGRYPDLDVGRMAKARASLVSAGCLAELAAEMRLGEQLLVGRGEEAAGGRHKPSILADAAEALIGAVYLDGGWAPARRLVLSMLGGRIAAAAGDPGGDDHKTVLQERVARTGTGAPSYRLSAEGPHHERTWRATVSIAGVEYGSGEGRTKKQAEQAAAAAALAGLGPNGGSGRPSPGGDGETARLIGAPAPAGADDEAARTP